MKLLTKLWNWLFPKPIPPKPKEVKPKKSTIVRLPKCPQEGKTSYNEQIAKQEALKMEKRNLITMRAYKCMFCPHWHLTHKKSKFKLH